MLQETPSIHEHKRKNCLQHSSNYDIFHTEFSFLWKNLLSSCSCIDS